MLMVTAVYIVAVLLLCVGFYFAHLGRTLQQVAEVAKTAFSTMTDSSLDDHVKEKTIQRCAIDMVKQAVSLFIKLAVILLVTAFPVWLTNTLNLIEIETFTSFVLRMDVILVTTVAMLVLVVGYKQINKT
jgi:hypothetical protein